MLVSLACFDTTAWAGDRELERQLNQDYADKLLTLRHFYEGDRLKFLSDGRLLGDATIGPWTLDGQIEIKAIHLKNKVVEIKGRRIHVVFDSKKLSNGYAKPLDQLTALDSLSGKQREGLEKSLRHLGVEIQIELSSSEPSAADVSSVMHAAFLMPGESMIEAVPEFWAGYFAGLEGRKWTAPVLEGAAYLVGGAVSAPRVVYDPDPEYSDEARKAKYQGTAVLWLVVDPSGKPRDILILRPLGLGLDEKALAAISTWKFAPAQKDGKPVAVRINVEVSFRLY